MTASKVPRHPLARRQRGQQNIIGYAMTENNSTDEDDIPIDVGIIEGNASSSDDVIDRVYNYKQSEYRFINLGFIIIELDTSISAGPSRCSSAAGSVNNVSSGASGSSGSNNILYNMIK